LPGLTACVSSVDASSSSDAGEYATSSSKPAREYPTPDSPHEQPGLWFDGNDAAGQTSSTASSPTTGGSGGHTTLITPAVTVPGDSVGRRLAADAGASRPDPPLSQFFVPPRAA
jgi:hypothetical protein